MEAERQADHDRGPSAGKMAGKNPARFTGRVQNYKRFRPSYPGAILGFLRSSCGLTPNSMVVDVAAGTGLFTELFLKNGNAVLAVEPNDEMRAVCVEQQAVYPSLSVLKGTAESTGVPSGCADFVTVAQAMHWFDLKRTREEFSRILRPGGWCVIAYNDRRVGGDPFHDAYEELMVRFGIDYELVRRRNFEQEKLPAFFAPFPVLRYSLPNVQALDLDALIGRVVSSSYMPRPEDPQYPAMLEAIERMFEENQKDGRIQLEYECTVYCGHLSEERN